MYVLYFSVFVRYATMKIAMEYFAGIDWRILVAFVQANRPTVLPVAPFLWKSPKGYCERPNCAKEVTATIHRATAEVRSSVSCIRITLGMQILEEAPANPNSWKSNRTNLTEITADPCPAAEEAVSKAKAAPTVNVSALSLISFPPLRIVWSYVRRTFLDFSAEINLVLTLPILEIRNPFDRMILCK